MHPRQSCRIVITGIGLCTPLGSDRESSWSALVDGKSGVEWVKAPHWTDLSLMPGAQVCLPENRPFHHNEPLVELGLTTASEALEDANLNPQELNAQSIGVVFGTSKGGLHSFSQQFQAFRTSGMLASRSTATGRSISNDLSWLDVLPNRPAAAIGQWLGGDGPILCPVAACATGLAACLRGAELIHSGACNVVLAGSADVSLQPALLSSFRRLGVLSRETEFAAHACRPFDRNRSGFVVGEGAACLVLESLESARQRGKTYYAEWIGGSMLSDPFGLTQLDPSGETLQKLLQILAAKNSGLPDYINLHGTGTMTNDQVESRAIRRVFGRDVDRFHCSSLKGGLGHLLGAAGSVELAATALAIRDQIVPPTVNLLQIDPDCELQMTPVTSVSRPINNAWKISMGFGGHVAGACLRKPE